MDITSFVSFLLSLLLILVQANGRNDSSCPKSFSCGNLTDLSFPFSLSTQPDCGIIPISGCDAKPYPRIRLLPGGDWYYALEKQYSSIWLGDAEFQTTLNQHKCQAFNKDFFLPISPSVSFPILNTYNFFKCNSTNNNTPNITQKKNNHFAGYKMYNGCKGFSIYYKLPGDDNVKDIPADNLPTNCSLIRLPFHSVSGDGDLFDLLGPEIQVEWKLSEDCNRCHYGGGQCQTDTTNKFYCQDDLSILTTTGTSKTGHRRRIWLILTTGTSSSFFFSVLDGTSTSGFGNLMLRITKILKRF
ncbi:LEAF RUST 10 DISEASE-RESISTANCE LOCUS RECEPTOR-LIKE PROTEIN KINASE-like 1.1 isoform X3 [Nicotiana tabacum]|uniref:LEAF RUST 10 DISEASE-RESISTANCE LOCUS RECEPTOR-LIKE PROTEIN KINASE-like 1.1 isoform X3 n=1 Tax=Nicotiana tabacum TaxID=4097 RepID=A0AC58THP2_TOBAC